MDRTIEGKVLMGEDGRLVIRRPLVDDLVIDSLFTPGDDVRLTVERLFLGRGKQLTLEDAIG